MSATTLAKASIRSAWPVHAGKVGRAVRLGLLAAGLALPHAATARPAVEPADPAQLRLKHADLAGEAASPDARRVADWVIDTGDNRGLPFLIIDKASAKVFAFNAQGRLGGAAPALLGLGRGDDSPPGIGERKLSAIAPAERITPAGRFEAGLGDNLSGQDILWVDYDAAVSLHRVIAGKPSERRLQRLASVSTLDNRITYGCINVPVKFYESVIRPIFKASDGIVYVLPETRSIQEVFSIPDSAASASLRR